MSGPRFTDPDFGTREEDWPDLDADSGTEEYAENLERAEAAMHASMERSLRKRRGQCDPSPSNVDDPIPKALYEKARDHQDQLTQEERDLLAGRDDLVGKTLASPDSLTTEEMYAVLGWAPPDVARDNIQRASGGTLSTPAELYAKANDALARGQFQTVISDEENALLLSGFRDANDDSGPDISAAAFNSPGLGYACGLLLGRLRLGTGPVARAALARRFSPTLPKPAAPIVAPLSLADLAGGPWPPLHGGATGPKRSPLHAYMHDKKVGGWDAHPGWNALPEHEKEAYRAQSETQRREAWAAYENATPEQIALFATPTLTAEEKQQERERYRERRQKYLAGLEQGVERFPGLEARAEHLTGLKLFREELGMGKSSREEFQVVLAKWDALAEGQREAYNVQARETNVVNEAAYKQRFKVWLSNNSAKNIAGKS